MTVIAAYTDGTTAALALDSATTYADIYTITNLAKKPRLVDVTSPKGKPRGQLAIASCGIARLTNEIVNRWTPPPCRHSDTAPGYMLDVALSLQDHLFAGGHTGKIAEASEGGGLLAGDLVAVWQARVFVIACDFSITEPACGYIALGSGGPIAMGALAELARRHAKPAVAVRRAVEASIEHGQNIRGPVQVVTVK